MWDSSFLQIISQVWLEPVLSLGLLKGVSSHHCECWTILISYMNQSLSSSCFQGMKVCLKSLCHVLVPKLLLLAGTYRLDRQRFPAPKWWGSELQVKYFLLLEEWGFRIWRSGEINWADARQVSNDCCQICCPHHSGMIILKIDIVVAW